ncbi:MAG: DUF1232 domain-containing protein [Bacteroidales bacterium]|nr:DUF1232 domain-containing protein [Bacteroidales bacterium]
MFITICVLVLTYMIMGKDVKSLLGKLKNVDWKEKIVDVGDAVRKYAVKAGRVACRPVLQFYYVLKYGETTVLEKALIYATISYTVLPFSILPKSVYGFVGCLDEGLAIVFVMKKIRGKITPEINDMVDAAISEWFGDLEFGM